MGLPKPSKKTQMIVKIKKTKEMNLILEMLDSARAIKPEVAKKVLNIFIQGPAGRIEAKYFKNIK